MAFDHTYDMTSFYTTKVMIMPYDLSTGNFPISTWPYYQALADVSTFDSVVPLAKGIGSASNILYYGAYEDPKLTNDYNKLALDDVSDIEQDDTSSSDLRLPIRGDASERLLLRKPISGTNYFRISADWLWGNGALQQSDFTDFSTFNAVLFYHVQRLIQEVSTSEIDQIRAIGTSKSPNITTALDDLATASTFLHKLLLKYFVIFVFLDGKTSSLSPASDVVEIPQINTEDTFTVTPATDKVNITAHSYLDDDIVRVFSDNTLPDPLEADTNYYVVNAGVDDFELSLTQGGSAVDITNTGTGTHTLYNATEGIKVVLSDLNLENSLGQTVYSADDVLEIHIYRAQKDGWDSEAEWSEAVFLAILEKTANNEWYYKENEKTIIGMTDANDQVEVTSHGYSVDDKIIFITNDGILPTGVSENTMYYVQEVVNDDNFKIATTPGAGSPLDFGSDATIGDTGPLVTRTYDKETYEDNVYSLPYNPFTIANVRSFACNDIVTHKNRLVLIGYLDVENRSVILYSEIGNSEAVLITNYRTIQSGDGETLIGGISVSDFLFLFKPSKIYGILGDTATGQLVDVSLNIGTEYRRTIVAYNNVVYFMNRTGVFAIDRNTVQEIRHATLSDYFDETQDTCIDFANCPDNAFGYVDKKNQTIHFYVPQKIDGESQTQNNLVIIYDIRLDLFRTYSFASNIFTREIFRDVVDNEVFYVMSNYSGDIYQADSSYTDLGNDITYTIRTKAFNVDDEIIRKSYQFIKIFGKNISQASIIYEIDDYEDTGNVTYREVGNNDFYEGITVVSNNRGQANKIVVKITGTVEDLKPVAIEEILVGYRVLRGAMR
jgi:hypothetical protein